MKSHLPVPSPVDPLWPAWAKLGAVLLVLTVHCSLLAIYYLPSPKQAVGDERIYLTAARHLLAGEEAQLDPLWPPLYPRFVAQLMPADGGSLIPVQAVQIVLLLAIAWILRDIARRLFGSTRAGDLTALLVLAYPPLVAFSHYLWPEILHLALFVASLWILLARRRELRWMPILGLLLGLALLTKSLLGPFLPLLLAPLLIGRGFRHALLCLTFVGLALGVTIAPTLLANQRATGELMIADSARFNLLLGLTAPTRRALPDRRVWQTFVEYRDSADSFGERNAILQLKIEQLVAERGIPTLLAAQISRQYFRLLGHQNYFSAQLPGGPLANSRRGYGGPPRLLTKALAGFSSVFYGLLLVLGAIGVLHLRPRHHPGLWLALAFVSYNLVIFLFLHAMPRYRIQLLPVLFLYTSGALSRWLEDGPRAFLRAPRWRSIATIAVASVLLFLAFGGGLID